MNQGILTLSFDCEGKWGFADHLDGSHRRYLTNINLISTYKRLLCLLDRYGIAATFAFTAAFTLSVDEYSQYHDFFHEVKIGGVNWLSCFYSDMELRQYDGWFCSSVFDMVKNSERHELASHGFTHIPFDSSLVSREDILYELSVVKRIAELKRVVNRTFVFPRNVIGFTDCLKRYGYFGYRNRLMSKSRLGNLISEFNLLPYSQNGTLIDDMVAIPAGYFLNWRNGLRKTVPFWVTKSRWRHVLKDAINHGQVAHLWMHPHNLITGGEQQWSILEEILKICSQYLRRGSLINMTQVQYCDFLRG